jgi:signal transduction histidine kinase
MEIIIFIILLAGIFNLLLSIFVWLKGYSQQLNQLFGIFGVITAFWILLNFIFYFKNDPNILLLRSGYAVGALVPISALLWILELCGRKLPKGKIIILITGFSFFLLSFSDLIILNIKKVYIGGFEGEAGPIFPLYFAYIGGTLVFIMYLLFSEYFKATGTKKLQISYVIIGAILYITVALLVNFILPLLGIFKFVALDTPSSLFLVFFTVLAITRYHLFGVRVILTELLVGLMGLILFLQVIFAQNWQWRISSFSTFLLFLIFAFYLVKSVHEEEKRREEAEKLAQKESELREKYQVLAIRLIAIEKKLREIAERERILRESAEKLSQAKTEFIAITSHQLRTPLTVIKGYLSMISEGDYGEISPKLKEIIEKVLQSTKRIIKLVNTILNISKIEAGEMEMNWQRVDLREIPREIIEEIKIKTKEKNLDLEFDEPKEKIENLVDKEKIREVILNLLDNAIKYTQKGKIIVRLKRIKEKNVDQISIKDEGEGMTKKELEKIFKRFSRGIAGMKFWTEGAGLGLFISKSFVEMHDGRIWAESEGKGKGSTFYIELPIR